MAPSRDVRAQFYSRMGLRATTVAQPPETVKEEHLVHPSCSSSADDEETTRISRKQGDEKELENKEIEHRVDDTFDAGLSGSHDEILSFRLKSSRRFYDLLLVTYFKLREIL